MRKNLIPALSISLLATLVIASLILSEQSKRIQGLQSANSSLNSQMETRRNIEGKLLAEKQTAVLRVKELEQSMPKLAAAITRDFDIKLKNLAGYLQTNFQARGSGQTKIVYKDTVLYKDAPQFAIIAQDGYLDFQADVYDSINAPYTYTYTDTAKMAFLMKRDKWYRQKKLYGSVLFSNPKASVLNTQSILVKEYRDKRFGIGPSVSYGISPDGMQWNVGISIHYSLIRF